MASTTIAKNRSTVKADVVNVTPKLATSWLLKNTKNRSVRSSLVDKYARDMASGNWGFTGEPVKFSAEGDLLDGQHRLHAVVVADTPVQMLVVKGLDATTQTVMDSGAARTASDALTLAGHHYTALTAAASRLAVQWQRGNFTAAHQSNVGLVTHSEIIDWVEQNPDIEQMAHLVSSGWRRIPARGSVLTFTSWACSRIDAAAAIGFFDDCAEMRTSGIGDPRQALLRRFQSAVEHRETVSAIQQADAVFRAWNAVRAGARLTRINPRFTSDNFTDPR